MKLMPVLKKYHKYLVICFLFISVFSACGSRLEGTYFDEYGEYSYSFTKDGKVNYGMGSIIMRTLEYKIKGDRVTIYEPGTPTNFELTLMDDGSLIDPLYAKLGKIKKYVKK